MKRNSFHLLLLVSLLLMCYGCSVAKPDTQSIAIKRQLLLNEDFSTPAVYTKEYQTVNAGWKVKLSHAEFIKTSDGLESKYSSGHMPVITYEGQFADVVIELEFRFFEEDGKWAACRVSATNPQLNPRAYAVSVWANQNNKARNKGMVLEHDEWKPGIITEVNNKTGNWQSGKWYKLRLEIIGNYVRATCNGITVSGSHEKFGIPKTNIYLGVGTCKHQIKNFKVYAAEKNPAKKI
ncbi:family 16 glycoside hydrolase [Lacibacter sp.]|uniref:family 16 glycoside hydrolase n=1 Tax=Lacibacter sp. TaxID=1915409 RepID=UPI002B4B8B6D|nr:family 16 glycoside hydrolase [Lacibacter sp.]HLP36313.1 family 16 glycoside hydrolase [Lacibacter sp.]